MKKILFISYNYPHGNFGASTLCTSRIMKALVDTGKFEIHCLSYNDSGQYNYDNIPGIKIHYIGIQCPNTSNSILTKVFQFLTYPLMSVISDFKHYKLAAKICKSEKFDLVISQCYPERSVISGVLLKNNAYVENLMVIFWDNIYGKITERLPVKYVLCRQRMVESFIAKYANTLVSLYPIKTFHESYGDVEYAIGKRFYLGIPSVSAPLPKIDTPYDYVLADGRINILFSGSIINKDILSYAVSLFNRSTLAEKISLIFFSRGVSNSEFELLRMHFKGSIINLDYIPIRELYGLYTKVDMFMSLSGNPRSISSKCYEYMSYGHPIILFFNDDYDVNVSTFSKYPLSLSIDIRSSEIVNEQILDNFISSSLGKHVPFSSVEEMFKLDSASAYVDLITKRL